MGKFIRNQRNVFSIEGKHNLFIEETELIGLYTVFQGSGIFRYKKLRRIYNNNDNYSNNDHEDE